LQSNDDPPPRGYYTLPVAVSRLLYTLVKIRGPKIILRFLPNQPHLLDPVATLFDNPSTGAKFSWELRYILLLWLSHLLLAPFDLSTISTDPRAGVTHDLSILDGTTLNIATLPYLSKRLLGLGISYLSSPGNRESDAAALLLIRISLRRDMRDMGLLDAMVVWGTQVMATVDTVAQARTLFLKTGVLAVLAGILAQGDSTVVEKFCPTVFNLVTTLQDEERDEWQSAGVRRLGMKIYRWVASLTPEHPTENDYIEDIIERLLNALGDRDTAVRFGASKSLAVVARKLDPDMAGDVLEAVMSVYEEDVFLDQGRKVFSAVSPEKWHGATLTLATFLRQRAVRSTDVMTRVVECIVQALSFEQRRSTFAVGGNVRDAACYAVWSLARCYTTDELQAAGDIVVPATEMEEARHIIQILATQLVTAGCLDPLGNVRRASSAALQEMVGRHSGCVVEGIFLVQAVDYNAVALRPRSVISVASSSVKLGRDYWKSIVLGLVGGWRGIGGSDDDGRRLAAASLGNMVRITYPTDNATSVRERVGFVLQAVLWRTMTEGLKHVEIYHGCLLALAEVIDQLDPGMLSEDDVHALQYKVFAKLKGDELVNPILRPELTAEAACRLVRSLCQVTPTHIAPATKLWRLWTAILEASLDRIEEAVLDQAVPAADALLEKIPTDNRQRLVESWCGKVADLTYRQRGHILALGHVVRSMSGADAAKVTDVLVSAARRKGEVEIRVAGIRALGSGTTFVPTVINTVLESLDDYAVDARGDVGSWVRAEAVSATLSLFAHPNTSMSDDNKWAFLGKISRLAVEKLDRLRLRAAEVFLGISGVFPSITPISPEVLQSPPEEYFAFLLPLLSHPQIRELLVEGFLTSAGAGSDSVLRASRTALLQHLTSCPSSRDEFAAALIPVFRRAVENSQDRITVPLMDVASLLIDMSLLPLTDVGKRLFILTQKAHFRTTSMPKLAAAIRLYTSLALAVTDEPWHKDVVTKLAGMLLHPFPRVRMEASAAVYLIAAEAGSDVAAGMELVDWGKNVKELVGAVKTVKAGLC